MEYLIIAYAVAVIRHAIDILGIITIIVAAAIAYQRQGWWWNLVLSTVMTAANTFIVKSIGVMSLGLSRIFITFLAFLTISHTTYFLTAIIIGRLRPENIGQQAFETIIAKGLEYRKIIDQEEQCVRELTEVWRAHWANLDRAGIKGALTNQIEAASFAFLPGIRENFPVFRREPESRLWSLYLTAILLAHTHPDDEVREAVRELKHRHFVGRHEPPLI
jgi:hypothetical protein